MRFVFRLQSVLNVRRHERDSLQQSVVVARELLAKQVADRDLLVRERTLILNELRNMNDQGHWSLEQVIERQRHADQLSQSVKLTEQAVEQAEAQLNTSLKLIVAADQAVRMLEKLAERQLQEFQSSEAKSAVQDFDASVNLDRRVA